MLPFTPTQFFEVFRAYNDAIWPAQVLAYGLGILATACLFRSGPVAGRIISVVLTLMWAWTGIAYHGIYFYAINSAALVFGVAFVAQGVIFLYFGVVRNEFRFSHDRGWRASTGIALIVYAGIVYPLLGLALGHSYSELPQFGVTPCPVTIFTFGCVLLTRRAVRWWIY